MSPEVAVFATLVAALTLYALLGGADFGAGVWEFNTILRAPERERELLYRAIGPVWEANHVWLIFAIVLLFSGFPLAFAALSRALWVPLLLALVGIIFRGMGFVLRSYAAGEVRQQQAWSAVFAFASTATPFFLGACAGAIASGRLRAHPTTEEVLWGWIGPLSIWGAFFGVGTCAYLAAVYLIREAEIEGLADLADLWQRRAISTGLWMGALSAAGLGLLWTEAPDLRAGFSARSGPLVLASAIFGTLSLTALWRRRTNAAVLCAALTVATVLWGWALGQYPDLLPGQLSLEEAKSPDAVLRMMLVATAVGTLLLAPSLALLFHLFKGRRPS